MHLSVPIVLKGTNKSFPVNTESLCMCIKYLPHWSDTFIFRSVEKCETTGVLCHLCAVIGTNKQGFTLCIREQKPLPPLCKNSVKLEYLTG